MKKASRRLRIITAGSIPASKREKCEMGGSAKYNILSVNIKVQFTFSHQPSISCAMSRKIFDFLAAEGAALEGTIWVSGSKEISVLVMHF